MGATQNLLKRQSNKAKMSKGKLYFGRTLFLISLGCFLFIGLIINLIQLILIASLCVYKHEKWRKIQCQINGHLMYVLLVPPIFMTYYWTTLELTIYVEDKQIFEDSRHDMLGILLPNHSYELDYLLCFALSEKFGRIGNYKSFSKDELKYLPVIGWGLLMSDIIFVKRNWQADAKELTRKLDKLFDYDQCVLGIFAEGTRWTPEKHQLSVEHAKSLGMKPFEYHLVPRSRGFIYSMRYLWREIILNKRKDEKLFRLFNIQFVMPDKPNFTDVMLGRPIRGDVFCEEVKLNQVLRNEVIQSRNEEDCPKLTQLLYDIYRRKDEIMEEYCANNEQFVLRSDKSAVTREILHSRKLLIIGLIEVTLTYGTLFYAATSTYLAHSTAFWTILVGFCAGAILMMRHVEKESCANNSMLSRRSRDQVAKLTDVARPDHDNGLLERSKSTVNNVADSSEVLGMNKITKSPGG